ncbi:hypothetical protein CCDG5_1155 [[Clostridium] cellulosi]|jgi:Ubiquinone biosynthesis protein COQ7.|uniref:Ubiquinone biosynthesis protein COQ7 n=1 Tax=[Clostridium] cellulosi TaxID=29343 RepID=A0A078KP14_9FIRM|nr:MAG: rubrerythrin family protein [[Clostridium] cellulosi]CDZ24272.1 hypothetical protein CCDG5_1155 [[Clostridium] cellulosi]
MALIGNPFVVDVPRKLSADELAQAIRVDIAGEYEAIIGYEAHALATDDENAKKVLRHIAEEEMHHVGELQELLFRLCPREKQKVEAGKMELQSMTGQ